MIPTALFVAAIYAVSLLVVADSVWRAEVREDLE